MVKQVNRRHRGAALESGALSGAFDAIKAEFQPALDPGTVQRLDRPRLSIEPWLERDGVSLENLELNVPDCLSLLKGLARVCKE